MMLRRLTRLSKIEFGYHAGKRVEQIMMHKNGKSYMKWLYFNASHIDLCQELLNDLDIKHVLMKPGKDPEIFEKYYYDPASFFNKHDMKLKTGLLHMIPPVTKNSLPKCVNTAKNRKTW